jgi:hypothetical protein
VVNPATERLGGHWPENAAYDTVADRRSSASSVAP